MPYIVIYSKYQCPYCEAAKRLLESKGVEYVNYDVDKDQERLAEMMTRSGRRTVPQVFINGEHIGGSDDLRELNRAGGLDPLLVDLAVA